MNEKKRTSCYRDARGRTKARGHFAMPRHKTPKDSVIARYPNAMCTRWVAGFIVTDVQTISAYLGKGRTPALAWANALSQIEAGERLWNKSPPRAVGRPREESKYDSELDALENG